MRVLLIVFTCALICSFSLLQPRKKTIYVSPDLDKTMVYMPAMSFNYQEIDLMKGYPDFDKSTVVSVKGFYIFPYEVSNGQYLEFLWDLKKSGDTVSYAAALPDTLVWRQPLAFNEPYIEYYLRHPAYRSYPMVGVTHRQCEIFCEWLTSKYNAREKRKFKKVKFRLPTSQEWYAAASYKKPEEKNSKTSPKDIYTFQETIFPWKGPYMRNKEGLYMANFKVIDEASIHREYDSVPNLFGTKSQRMRYVGEPGYYMGLTGNIYYAADITAPVNAFWPNDAGMYNMAGNVEEFVAEKGFTKGGSWDDTGFYLRNSVVESYDSTEATSSRGFRFVMDVVEE